MKRITTLALLALFAMLTGCGTVTISSQVSSFHEWPAASPDKSYTFDASLAQQAAPEYRHAEALLRQALQAKGFSEGATADAHLKISMNYGTSLADIEFSGPWYPAIYGPYWRVHFSRGMVYRNYYPYPFTRFNNWWMWQEVNVRRYYLHQLEIFVSEAKTSKKLADIKASTEQLDQDLQKYLPYLIESALQDFPGTNGQTRTVELPLAPAAK